MGTSPTHQDREETEQLCTAVGVTITVNIRR